MKLSVIAQIYNESERGNLLRFLDSCRRFADHVILYDDGSTDDTYDICSSIAAGNVQPYLDLYYIRSDDNDFKNEIRHKSMLLNVAINDLKSDWVLWLDADEAPEKDAQDGGIRKELESVPPEFDGVSFHQINLWRSDRFYRVDSQYNDGWFVRAWRNNGRLKYDERPGLHQRQYPLGVDKVVNSQFQIIHYGFATDQNILGKYNMYKSHGQTGWALDRIVDEKTLAVRRTKSDWLREPLQGPTEVIFGQRLVDKI